MRLIKILQRPLVFGFCFSTCIFAGVSVHAQNSAAVAEEVCAPLRDARFQGSEFHTRVSNCKDMVMQQKVKNLDALRYTVKYFANNYRKLRDSGCAQSRASTDRECGLCQRPDQIEKGIQNGCTMILNDVETNYPADPKRSTAYFLDLCADNPSGNVATFYMNRGKGHAGRTMYDDKGGRRSTLMGAFLTDTVVKSFSPYSHPERYRNLCGIRNPQQVRLLGVNSTNDDSDYSKPLHVSPYSSSWGCPSVSCESVKYMRELAENGPSLVMNFATSRMANAPESVRTGQTCINGPDDVDQPGAASLAPATQPAQGAGRNQ
jgi:hypothetical protein